MRLKVISDNGYRIELIRPTHEYPLQLGAVVDLSVIETNSDLMKLFDSMLDEDTQTRLIERAKQALKTVK